MQGGRSVYIEKDFDNTGGLGGSVTSAALLIKVHNYWPARIVQGRRIKKVATMSTGTMQAGYSNSQLMLLYTEVNSSYTNNNTNQSGGEQAW